MSTPTYGPALPAALVAVAVGVGLSSLGVLLEQPAVWIPGAALLALAVVAMVAVLVYPHRAELDLDLGEAMAAGIVAGRTGEAVPAVGVLELAELHPGERGRLTPAEAELLACALEDWAAAVRDCPPRLLELEVDDDLDVIRGGLLGEVYGVRRFPLVRRVQLDWRAA